MEKLSDTQTGFRKNKNTEDQLTYFAQKIENGFQEGKKTVAVFFDMTKVFDTVWKDGLLLKLVKSGIAGNMYKWIKSFLENRTARVKMDGVYSRKVNLKEGVPQGSANLSKHFSSSSSTKLCQQQVQMSRTPCMQMILPYGAAVNMSLLQICKFKRLLIECPNGPWTGDSRSTKVKQSVRSFPSPRKHKRLK